MPKVSVLVLKLGPGIVFWHLNNDFVQRWILRSSSFHVIISTQSSHQILLLPKLQTVLAVPHHASVTLDIWTDRSMHSFMAITVHTFSDCNAYVFLLPFQAFKGSHTGVRIAEEYEKTLLANSLVGKVDFCLTDNASNMGRAFDVIASFHDEETSLAIKYITACILYIYIILI